MLTVDFRRFRNRPPGKRRRYRVLDVGCGTGRHTAEAYRLRRASVVGVDLHVGHLAEAAGRLRWHHAVGEHGGGDWALGAADTRNLPFADGCFDLVICSEVLEHVPDHGSAVREIVRVLKTGGDLAVSVPRYYPERICWALSKTYRRSPGGHVRIYRRSDLVRRVEAAGTRLSGAHFAHSLHTPFWWLKCLVGPDRDEAAAVKCYHRFLVWDMMRHPAATRVLDRLLNPVLGKSLVCYFRKR